MHGISRTELQSMLEHVEQAVHNHAKWYEDLTRILVCRLPFDSRLATPDAHRQCAFGRWYYHVAPEGLHSQPSFVAIEAEHEAMHQRASRLLLKSQNGSIAAQDFDDFNARMEKFRLELGTLKTELEIAVGNLDPLTGLYNRVGMLTWLRTQQELVKRQVLATSIAMFDLDRFKAINDNYGHLAGDRVLAGISRYLSAHVRPYDRIYRYGGEEFLLCMQGATLDQAHMLVDRLREGVAVVQFSVSVDGNDLHCTVSCGLAPLSGSEPVEVAIEHADRALYAAKSAGRNCTRLWG